VASGWRLYTLANFEESEQRGWWLAAGVSTLLPTLRRASSEQRGGWLAASWCLAGGWELAAGWWLAADVSTLLPTLRGASSEQRGWRRAVGGGRLAAGGWRRAAGGWRLAGCSRLNSQLLKGWGEGRGSRSRWLAAPPPTSQERLEG
jgi:hypothetical protein